MSAALQSPAGTSLLLAIQASPVGGEGPATLAVRVVWYVAVLLAVGAATFRWRILPAAAAAGAASGAVAQVERRALSAALLAGGLAAAAAVARVLPAAGARGTLWTGGLLLHALGAGLVLLGAALAARATGRERRGWAVLAAGAALLSFAPALAGHAVEAPLPLLAVLIDAVHVAACGAWLGSLALLLSVLPTLLARPGDGAADLGRIARAFSAVALPAAIVVVASGLLRTIFHVRSAAALWRTVYGNTLTFKVGIAAGALLLGLYNWRKVLPRLDTRRGPGALRRSGALEVFFALVVLLLTAVLVTLPLP